MKIEIDHTTPSGTLAFEACLYFDDGNEPNAEVEGLGYFTEEKEAWDAVKAALKSKPRSKPSKVEPGNRAVWLGMAEKGTFTKDEDDEWFMDPSFERDEDYNPEPIYHD